LLDAEARFCSACGTQVGAALAPSAPTPWGQTPSAPPYAGSTAPSAPYATPQPIWGTPVPSYGAPPSPYAPPPFPVGPSMGTNGLAVASLVLSLVFVCGIGSLLAVIFGYAARRQIRERGGEGAGMALAGIIIGWIGVALMAFYIVVTLAVTMGGNGS
jgi:uncharacterized protein DUF4190